MVAPPVSFGADRRVAPDRVAVGGVAESLVTVANEGRRRSGTALALDRVGEAAVEIAVPALSPGRSHTVPYRLPTDRRAVLDVGPLLVVRSDPLGLAERRVEVGGAARLWVHPRVHAVAPLPVGRSRDLEGPRPTWPAATARSTPCGSTSSATTCAASTGRRPPTGARSWCASTPTRPGPT